MSASIIAITYLVNDHAIQGIEEMQNDDVVTVDISPIAYFYFYKSGDELMIDFRFEDVACVFEMEIAFTDGEVICVPPKKTDTGYIGMFTEFTEPFENWSWGRPIKHITIKVRSMP